MGDAYALAVDVGASTITAATARRAPGGAVSAAPVPLGVCDDAIPAVAFVEDDGSVLIGDTARARGMRQPHARVDGLPRLVGDDVPLLVAGWRIRPEALFAAAVAHVVEFARRREGRDPDRVTVVCPLDWGAYRRTLAAAALGDAGVADVDMISAPLAAARRGAAEQELDDDRVLVVYDLGATSFAATLVGEDEDRNLRVVGEPIVLTDLGGADIDDAVVRHAVASSATVGEAISAPDATTQAALSAFRDDCVAAKEALSRDSAAVIPITLGPEPSSIRLTRAELETLAAPLFQRTLDGVDAALATGGLTADQVARAVPIGGGARMPLVAQRLSQHLDRPVAVDADPAFLVCLEAARWGWECAEQARMLADVAEPPEVEAQRTDVEPPAPTRTGIPLLTALAGRGRTSAERAGSTRRVPDGLGAERAVAADRETDVEGREKEDLLAGARLTAPREPAAIAGRWYSAALIAGAAIVAAGIVLGGSMAAGWRLGPDDTAFPPAAADDDDSDAGDDTPSAAPRLPGRAERSAISVVAPHHGSSGAFTAPPAPKTGLRILDDPPALTPASPLLAADAPRTASPRRIPILSGPTDTGRTPTGESDGGTTVAAPPVTEPDAEPAPPAADPAPAGQESAIVDPAPDPGSTPAPATAPDPDPAPTPDPAPATDPTPTSEPTQSPDPDPAPSSDPTQTSDPAPTSDPVPTSDPDPAPSSDPVPTSDPAPASDPAPTSDSAPTPDPSPTPDPADTPDPAPANQPIPEAVSDSATPSATGASEEPAE